MTRQQYKMSVCGVLAISCLVLLFFGGPGYETPRSYHYAWDMGHLICFGLWTYIYLSWRPQQSFWWQLFWVVLLAFSVGGATELLQALVGRSASWEDLRKDLLGSVTALVLLAPSRHSLQRWQLLSLRALVVAALLWILYPFALVALDDLVAWQQFPLLSGFETPLEKSRWGGRSQLTIDRDTVYRGEASLRVELDTRRYSGVILRHFPGDWRGYRWLSLQVFNPEKEPLPLYFRIHDRWHRQNGNAHSDRFNARYTLAPGWTTLDISLAEVTTAPRSRKMDLSRIAGLVFYVAQLDRPRIFYLDNVRLLP